MTNTKRSSTVSDSTGAVALLRAGVKATPELRPGLWVSLALAIVVAALRLVVPLAVRQVLDKGMAPGHVDVALVAEVTAAATVAIVVLTLIVQRLNYRVLFIGEQVLYGLRTRAFAHAHRLSLAAHNDTKRGVLVARVTSDVETLAQFVSWGAMSWVINLGTIVVTFVALVRLSSPLAVVAAVVLLPILPIFRVVQARQLRAYNDLRNTVSATLSHIGELTSALPVVRSYGYTEGERQVVHGAIGRQLAAQTRARLYFSLMFPISDLFGGVVLAAVTGFGVWFGPSWGISVGTLVAFLLLTNQLMQPVAEIGEVLDQTQTAISGWRKILMLLQQPVDIVEPENGRALPAGALSVQCEDVVFSYDDGPPVLMDVNVMIPAGTNVAIVGETGSGKSTLSKLLCRLADPDSGRVVLGGIDLRDVAPDSRREAIRLVPQDGFLFDGSVADNVRMGRPGATDEDVLSAFEDLGLMDWLNRLPAGMHTEVGQRGDGISVGERQLVALARAELSDPGLLLLDEATSNVDPDTERALARAMEVLSRGRTTISVAHRLSTAESADLVIVFDAGRIVQIGSHADLVASPGVYSHLHRSWIGNTRSGDAHRGSLAG